MAIFEIYHTSENHYGSRTVYFDVPEGTAKDIVEYIKSGTADGDTWACLVEIAARDESLRRPDKSRSSKKVSVLDLNIRERELVAVQIVETYYDAHEMAAEEAKAAKTAFIALSYNSDDYDAVWLDDL